MTDDTNKVSITENRIDVEFEDIIPWDVLSEELKQLVLDKLKVKGIELSNCFVLVGKKDDTFYLLPAYPQVRVQNPDPVDIEFTTQAFSLHHSDVEGTNSPYTDMLKALMNGLKDLSGNKE